VPIGPATLSASAAGKLRTSGGEARRAAWLCENAASGVIRELGYPAI
jgi:hypothetical protein